MEDDKNPEAVDDKTPLDTKQETETHVTPNAHNTEPMQPRLKNHHKLYIAMGALFAVMALALGALIILRAQDDSAQETAQANIVESEQVFTDASGVPVTVESSKVALSLLFEELSAPLSGQELEAQETARDSEVVQHRASGLYVYLDEDFGFEVNAVGERVLEPDALRESVNTVFNPKLHAGLETAGFALASVSELDLSEADSAVYENAAVSCSFTIELGFEDNVSRVTCHQPTRVDEYYTELEPLLASLSDTDFDITNGVQNTLIQANFETQEEVNGYILVRGSAGGFTTLNGAPYSDGTGGGLDFYRGVDGTEWNYFPVGQSISFCSEYDTAAEQAVYADTACAAADGSPPDVKTVAEFYTRES